MPTLSLRGYAWHRGVNLYDVHKAIPCGRITPLPEGRIDSDVTDAEWKRNTIARPLAVPGPTVARRVSKRGKEKDEDGIGLSSAAYSKAPAIR